jgi:hypothetical protein
MIDLRFQYGATVAGAMSFAMHYSHTAKSVASGVAYKLAQRSLCFGARHPMQVKRFASLQIATFQVTHDCQAD